MSRLHVMRQISLNLYLVVAHTPVPAGNNSASVAWSIAIKNAGLAVTSMETGTGPGQITLAEATDIANGVIFETQFVWQDNPAWSNIQRLADLNLRASQETSEAAATISRTLKFFGFEVA